MKLPAFLLVTVSLAALVGCGSGETPPDITFTGAPSASEAPTALVRGNLLRVGGPAPGSPVALPGTITFTASDGRVTTTDVDTTGRYAVSLAPGDYRITGTSPRINGGAQICATVEPVTTVTVEKNTTADVICSIK